MGKMLNIKSSILSYTKGEQKPLHFILTSCILHNCFKCVCVYSFVCFPDTKLLPCHLLPFANCEMGKTIKTLFPCALLSLYLSQVFYYICIYLVFCCNWQKHQAEFIWNSRIFGTRVKKLNLSFRDCRYICAWLNESFLNDHFQTKKQK